MDPAYREIQAREKADHRYGQALWYAFGRKDAGETVDTFAFAHAAQAEAFNYYIGDYHVLHGVQDQYERLVLGKYRA